VVRFKKGQVRRGKENWEGEAPAEPKRRRLAISDWRLVKRQRVANGE